MRIRVVNAMEKPQKGYLLRPFLCKVTHDALGITHNACTVTHNFTYLLPPTLPQY